MHIFKERLLELRKEKGLSQDEVSLQLDISRSTYANWEQGRREPDIAGLIMLAKFFMVSVDYLVGVE